MLGRRSAWARSIPASSCRVLRSFPRPFLMDVLQGATLDDDVISAYRLRTGLLLLPIKAVNAPSGVFLSCSTTYRVCEYSPSSLWDSAAQGANTHQHEALATGQPCLWPRNLVSSASIPWHSKSNLFAWKQGETSDFAVFSMVFWKRWGPRWPGLRDTRLSGIQYCMHSLESWERGKRDSPLPPAKSYPLRNVWRLSSERWVNTRNQHRGHCSLTSGWEEEGC